MLEKVKTVDKIEIVENSCLQIRNVIRILEDGNLISETYERRTIAPGDDYSNEDPRVQAVCSALHTPEVISAYTVANPQ